jgi:uncharacterized protein (TIGR02466 family)
MPPSIDALFVTRLYRASLADGADAAGVLAALEAACRDVAANDAAGRAWSRAHGYRGYTSYASLSDLPVRAPEFAQLKRRLDRHAAAFAEALQFDLGGRRLRLDSLWINLLRPGGAHSGHIHPHSVLSGTVYVSTPPGAGAIRFEDPRLPLQMAQPPAPRRRARDAQTSSAATPAPATSTSGKAGCATRSSPTPAPARGAKRVSLSFNYAWG